MYLRPGRRRSAARSCAVAAHALFQPGQQVRVVQKVRRLHAVVAHQAQQRGAVTLPVAAAQRVGLGLREAQFAHDVLAHRLGQLGIDAFVASCSVSSRSNSQTGAERAWRPQWWPINAI
jgi:hypothetical protein